MLFDRRGDRFGHTVEADSADGRRRLLHSVEGGLEAWPPSPPFQELHLHSGAAGRLMALLVGRGGQSHWSASVELDPAAGRIVWDIACRVQQPPRWLGSTYQTDSSALGHAGPAADRLGRPGDRPWQLRAESGPDAAARLEAADDRLRLIPLNVAGPWPTTVRWRYVLEPAAGRCGISPG